MDTGNVNRRITVRAVVVHENRLLCVRQKHYDGAVMSVADYWCLPGGGLEPDEALIDGVKREMVEETGVMPEVGNLLYIQQFTYEGKTGPVESLEFFFHVTNAADYLAINLAQTTHGEQEIADVAFVDPATANIMPKFLTTEPLAERIQKGVATVVSFPQA